MKFRLVMVALTFFTSSCFAQNNVEQAKQTVNKLIYYLRSIPLSRVVKVKAEQNTFKFYDTVMYQFFDTATMMKNFVKDTDEFAIEGKIDFQRFFLGQLHLYVLITPNIELSTKVDSEDSTILDVYLNDKQLKHSYPDISVYMNPSTYGIVAVSPSISAFEGKEEKLKQLDKRPKKDSL